MFHLFQFFGQIRYDGLVRLDTAKNEGRKHVAQFLVAFPIGFQVVRKFLELVGRSEDALVQKVKKRPEVCKVVLYGCAGHGNLVPRLDFLESPGLFGKRILDSLGFVQNQAVPNYFLQAFHAHGHAVSRDVQKMPVGLDFLFQFRLRATMQNVVI